MNNLMHAPTTQSALVFCVITVMAIRDSMVFYGSNRR
jgi:hypothetical protein